MLVARFVLCLSIGRFKLKATFLSPNSNFFGDRLIVCR
mgnify:CR=1 FL=1